VADVVGVGIRGISQEEVEVAEATPGVTLLYADRMWEDDGWMDSALEALGDPVYITFDVDYFDPSLVPSTGTPEPGGGDWYRTLRFLRRVFRERTVLACDVVELAPVPGPARPGLPGGEARLQTPGVPFRSLRLGPWQGRLTPRLGGAPSPRTRLSGRLRMTTLHGS
jgi:hypothetical protein